MKFKAKFRAPRIQLGKYQQQLHEHLSDAIAHAAFVWLEAVLSEIPVWSGASHATFLRLAREVGYHLSIAPSALSRISYGQRQGDGEVVTDPQQGLYLFRYQTTLTHLIYNEFHNANADPDPDLFHRLIRPGPYYFQQKGRMAFERYAAGVRLPSPWRALKIRTYRV